MVQRPLQVKRRCPLQQERPETGHGRKLTQQCVQIDDTPKSARESAFVEQVGRAVQHHVGRREHLHPWLIGQRLRCLQQALRAGPDFGSGWHQGVVHIEHSATAQVPQRR